jgi:hypothetical protein
MANNLGLPEQTSPNVLVQAAMERPELITPEEFKTAYAWRSV